MRMLLNGRSRARLFCGGHRQKPGLNLLVEGQRKWKERQEKKPRAKSVELNNIIESDVESVINNECDAPAFSVTQTERHGTAFTSQRNWLNFYIHHTHMPDCIYTYAPCIGQCYSNIFQTFHKHHEAFRAQMWHHIYKMCSHSVCITNEHAV